MADIDTLEDKVSRDEPEGKKDFNYYITKFFLENSRLTILALLLLIFLGLISTLLLKTTGFPNHPNQVAVLL